MNNVTNEIFPTNNLFRRYLLGESIKNIFIRFGFILSAIIIVWCGIMFSLIIHMKCQRAKQTLKTSTTQHHLCDSNSSLNKKRLSRSKLNRRFTSSASLSSTPCYSIRRILSVLKKHCIFWPSSTVNENSRHRSLSLTKQNQQIETFPKNSYPTSNKIQLVVESMTRRPLTPNFNTVNIGKRISLYREADNSSGDELKNLHSFENNLKPQIEINPNMSNTIQLVEPKSYIHHTSISFPINETKGEHLTKKRLKKLYRFNTRATLFFHPITRHLSNTNANISLLPTNKIQKQQQQEQCKPLLMISSARELASNNEWKCKRSSIDEPTITDGSLTSSTRHIPLVMITDTSSSNTNIVELETFDDQFHLIGDIERRLSKELRATYRPRHST